MNRPHYFSCLAKRKPEIMSVRSTKEHPSELYGGSYKSMDQCTHFSHALGLVMSTAIHSLTHAETAQTNPHDTHPPRQPRRWYRLKRLDGYNYLLSHHSGGTSSSPRHRITQMMGLSTYPRRLSVSIFATLKVRHPTRNITTVKCSQWTPLWLLVVTSS